VTYARPAETAPAVADAAERRTVSALGASGLGALRSDTLLDGRVRLCQPIRGYRAAIDPVLLAAAVPARDGECILDLGTGVGAAALCLLARVPALRLVGLDRDPGLAALARHNAARNAVGDRFHALSGDVAAAPLRPARVDQVMANPPYLPPDRGRRSPDPARDRANVEGHAALADWITAALRLVRPRGAVTVIHRADRLDALLAALHGRAGAVEVCPIWPRAGQPARRVVVRARRDRRTPLRLAPGLVLHDADGQPTAAAEAVLRAGCALADVGAL